ncbi:enoyl-CoA hydratase/isomerase family protein [Rhodococcus wratislaviensis]|uniref:enoyl-CoA hydratase/isomerase family protein n=1 Tax=Rhodococcus wratislaviensis TaxID=44752 RepID=UPI003653700A
MADSSTEGLEIDNEDGVTTVRLTRPTRHNAIDNETSIELATFFNGATTDRSVRAIVVTGVDRVFCTGADVVRKGSERALDRGPLDYRYATEPLRRMFHAMWEVEKPVISAVNGTVAGAGWMLALLADLVVADREARWTHVFSRRAMVPHAGDSYYLPRIIPFHRLNEIALLSDTLTTETLADWGLVNRSVGAENVFPTAMELAQRLANGPTRTLGLTKRLYRHSLSNNAEASFEEERNAMALVSTTHDRKEGVRSFVEGRTARFIGD